ncbi:MAG: tyrosine-type recombinase/integrase [Thermodesulfobacteriota bacterium]
MKQFKYNTMDVFTSYATSVKNNILPTIIVELGDHASRRFLEFFTANIRNINTRKAYAKAIANFLSWCENRGIQFKGIEPITVAAYIEQHPASPPTVKQHLAAIRMLFDWLVVGQVVPSNPATYVRGPKYVVEMGKTPILSKDETRILLSGFDSSTVVGLRDRALIGVMIYSFARVGAVVAMKVEDYYWVGKRWLLRLHEKGGKYHEVPAHHKLEEYMDEYIQAASIGYDKKGPLFRTTMGKTKRLTIRPMHPADVFRMIRRKAKKAGISTPIGCHTFRAIGITNYLENGGTLEYAQAMAAHSSPRTTKLYDRTSNEITLDEVERIII